MNYEWTISIHRSSFIIGVELWKYILGDVLLLNERAQSGDEVEFVVCDLLLADPQLLGGVFVGPAADEEQLGAHELGPFSFFPPALDLLGEGVDDGLFFQRLSLAAAG